MTTHRQAILATVLLCAPVLAACGDETAGTGESSTDTAQGQQITTAETDLGTVLVDDDGRTLYAFTQDSPGRSTCEGACLDAWPPLPAEVAAGEGVDEDLVGSIERGDGTTQATYGDWPLYYFAQDEEAGDVNGQGVNDVWYVVAPDGELVTEPAGTHDGGGGYQGGY